MRKICTYCGKKREAKFIDQLPKEIQIATNSTSRNICKTDLKLFNEKGCLEKFTEMHLKVFVKKSALLNNFKKNQQKKSSLKGRENEITLLEMIEDVEKNGF